MKFKVGDKVVISYIPKWYGGVIKLNEKCTITEVGHFSDVMWVCNANGRHAPIYKSWVTKSIPKNQQLLFDFAY